MRPILALLCLAALPSPAAAAGSFDGTWLTLFACTAARDGAAGYTRRFLASVRDGRFHGEIGVQGQASYLAIDGTIQPDGHALLEGRGFTGNADYSVGRVRPATPYHFTLQSRFHGGNGTGTRIELRPCEAVFTRQ